MRASETTYADRRCGPNPKDLTPPEQRDTRVAYLQQKMAHLFGDPEGEKARRAKAQIDLDNDVRQYMRDNWGYLTQDQVAMDMGVSRHRVGRIYREIAMEGVTRAAD
jgi:hypothetical protein